jgi:tetratricopeptide (TPR) repeat protein
VLLEHDAYGVRYSPKADLNEAISNYQLRRVLLSEEDAKDDNYANNLLYALLYARRFPDLREALRKLPPGTTQRALTLAAIGAESGSAKALEYARGLSTDESDRRTALASAGNLLVRLREYASAADLIEASTRGQTTTAANTQRIAMLRKTRRNDGKQVQPTDPRSLVLRWFVELLAVETNEDGLRKLLAPGSEFIVENPEFVAARRGIIAGLRQQDLPYEVTTDILFSNVRVNVEGDDPGGYRVQLRMTGDTQTFYVVKSGADYRILSAESLLGPVALEAQERIEAGDFAGARRWLDWARVEQRPSSTDDPLAGPSFSRAWTVGAETDLSEARAATAMLLADSGLGERAVPLLVAARTADASAADKLSLDLALARAYLDLERWTELREVASRLVAAVPNSAQAVRYQQWAMIQLGQWDAVEKAARERLARMPDDSLAREILVRRAEARGEFRAISGIMQPLIDSGRATVSDYNQYAWTALLTQPVDERAVDAARMAYDETQGKSYAIAHTLACVYAATGKPREARDLLLKGMEMVGIDRPDNSAWYGFGLVAEAYGDTESARDYYSKVEKPKKGLIEPSSVYALSQARLSALTGARR